MVINLRGTSGAGKSTVVRKMMAYYPVPNIAPVYVKELAFKVEAAPSRKRPFGYILTRVGRKPLWIPGHYEAACGGCDTITKVDDVYASVRYYATIGFNVLFEGIMVQDDVKRAIDTARLLTPEPFTVYVLTTPIATCLQSVQLRRDARGETKPFNSKNTIARDRSVRNNAKRLSAASVPVLYVDRDACARTVAANLLLSEYPDDL